MNAELGRLRWQCRRSCLEIDLLLAHFLDDPKGYATLDEDEKIFFATLLAQADSDLLAWLLSRAPCPEPSWRAVLDKIRQRIHECAAI
jgi:antitoxin CptB